MRPALGITIVCVGALALRAFAAEPPPKGNGALDPNDPLLKALEQVQQEVDALRRESGAGMGSPKSYGGGMVAPSMPAPNMSSPGMPRTVTKGTPRAAPLFPGGGPAPQGREIGPAPRSIATPRALPPATRETTPIWSFQPLKAPAVPQPTDTAWPRDDVDRFLLTRLETAKITPNPEADAAALCRRVTFDLTGLPPTEEELATFVRSFSPSPSPSLSVSQSATRDEETRRLGEREKAYEALVDRLLASPRFGERWARHWLDVVRYADSVGRSWNAPFTYAWRYRDYVIDAYNADTSLEQFILQQLAGDQLPASDPAARRTNLTATGLLALGTAELRPESHEQFLMDRVDDQIDVTTRGFLGLTISCARCHDHKYDPVTTRDYYALAGIFYSTYTLTGQGWQGDSGPGGYVDASRLVRLPALSGSAASLYTPGSEGEDVHTMGDYQRLWSGGLRNIRYATDPNVAMGVTDDAPQDCPIREKGEPYARGEVPPRGDLRIPSLPRLPPIPPNSAGRLQLAQWIASKQNPLTARVYVNRVWRHLFGRGLVRTVDDFGSTGEEPTHPELLDHLAATFTADGGSTKRLIRRLVLSSAYRTSSAGDTPSGENDPANELHGRASLRRLEWEPLRDALLSAAGTLELERPQIVPVSGIGGKAGQSAARSIFGLDAPYRTIYLPVIRGGLDETYGTFDFPDPAQIKGDRETTTVAPQALYFLNDEFVVDCCQAAAARLLEAPGLDDVGRVRLAYLRLLGRTPSADEIAAVRDFASSLQPDAAARDATTYRWTALVQALVASAEFRYLR
ncbi:MAG: hypothetical protein C0483_23800 [Pirellula sp.]|nr:hypothetical protein [Pirellula sp.]